MCVGGGEKDRERWKRKQGDSTLEGSVQQADFESVIGKVVNGTTFIVSLGSLCYKFLSTLLKETLLPNGKYNFTQVCSPIHTMKYQRFL